MPYITIKDDDVADLQVPAAERDDVCAATGERHMKIQLRRGEGWGRVWRGGNGACAGVVRRWVWGGGGCGVEVGVGVGGGGEVVRLGGMGWGEVRVWAQHTPLPFSRTMKHVAGFRATCPKCGKSRCQVPSLQLGLRSNPGGSARGCGVRSWLWV